ncbi:MAG: hypothetical protein R2706_15800 [Acidimicrobiales bacterium]
MMQLNGPGVVLQLPASWEVEIDAGSGLAEADATRVRTPRIHAANFPLPPERGDFGSGAVERMISGDVLICLLEEDPSVIGSRLFQDEGMPRLSVDDFFTDGMQRRIAGQSGAQVLRRGRPSLRSLRRGRQPSVAGGPAR